jgi:hypothetical protein
MMLAGRVVTFKPHYTTHCLLFPLLGRGRAGSRLLGLGTRALRLLGEDRHVHDILVLVLVLCLSGTVMRIQRIRKGTDLGGG